ncbi:MAG: Tol-Pal system beta propeller repeat protein TolB [Pseudomonadota bacterium]
MALSDFRSVRASLWLALISLFWALAAPATFAAQSLDTIIIESGNDRPTRIAVVPFAQPGLLASAAPMAGIIGSDLARSGQFAPLEAGNMLSLPTDRQSVFFRDWRVLGVEYLVIGRTQQAVDGRLSVGYSLFDVANEREVRTEEYVAASDGWRDLAHQVADDVYEAVTGIRGAFSTKILYILAERSGRPDARYSLMVADSDGAREQTLFRSSEPMLSANWGPQGKRVAYTSFETGRSAIVMQDLETGLREQLTNFRGINGSPVFSPDGRQLAMVLSKDGNPELYLMDLETRALKRLTKHWAIDTEPSWAPDGKSLIFTSDRGGKPQIYRIATTGGKPERLTYQGDYNARARMLETGEQLIMIHRRRGIFHVAWLDLPRDDLRVLTSTSLDESPSVAPNGVMLIYATQVDNQGVLAVVSVDGRVRYRLPSSAGDVREPSWSPYLPTVVEQR